MVTRIENDNLSASIKLKGAELCSLVDKATGTEYIWQADPQFWARHAPIMFPVCGRCKDDTYTYNGRQYTMPQHGFARDSAFTAAYANADSAQFVLTDNEATHGMYPFSFEFRVSFTLKGRALETAYQTVNTDSQTLYFSCGSHTAYRCPIDENERFDDYELVFDKTESIDRYFVKGGLLQPETVRLLDNENILPLGWDMFKDDALILKHPASEAVTLRSRISGVKLRVEFPSFAYLLLWTKPNSRFLCIEPWLGIGESAAHDGQLIHKEGIIALEPGGSYTCTHRVIPG